MGSSGKSWFHAIVIVGASLTAAPGCGGELTGADAHVSEGGSSADAATDVRTDGSSSKTDVLPDTRQVTDVRVDYPQVLIPAP